MNKKSKYFVGSTLWSKDIKDLVGLPRPIFFVPIKKQKKQGELFKNNFFLHPIVPIPWQSMPVDSETDNILILDVENEYKVVDKHLCTFCGVNFKNEDICIRWKDMNEIASHNNGPRVFSDNHPLHLECMVQARIFCPFMRSLKDDNFEKGQYVKLRLNFEKMYNKLKKENK